MAIILQESLRAIFYAPFYVALAHDAFKAEGVEIKFVSSPRPQDAAVRLMDGTVDVCWAARCASWTRIKTCRAATS